MGSECAICLDGLGKDVTVVEMKDGWAANSILLAAGMKPDKELVESFFNTAPRVFQISDCIKAGRVVETVNLGYYRAMDI